MVKHAWVGLQQTDSPTCRLCAYTTAKCALVSGLRNEAEQLLASLKSVHQAEIKAVSDIAATVAFVEVCGYDILSMTEK